jgi:D-arabinose 1-dehydrogenase-like Zn-dependent alcohol dehydrogenase
MRLLDRDGALVEVGLPENPMPVSAGTLTACRLSLAGSNIGGVAETQEMLEFAAEKVLAATSRLSQSRETTMPTTELSPATCDAVS